MKKFLPLALSLCGAALLIGSLFAANVVPPPAAPLPPAPGSRPDEPRRARLGDRLGLTGEQQQRLEDIRAEISRRRLARGPQGMGARAQGFGFAAPQGPQANRPADPLEMIQQGNRMAAEGQKQLARQLGLTDEQSNKLRDLSRQHQEKAQALQKEFHDQMQSVLTPEQQEKAKAMHAPRGPGGERPDHGPGRGRPDMPPPGR